MEKEAIVEMLRLLLGSYKHYICRILVRHPEDEVDRILFLMETVPNSQKGSLVSLDHGSLDH